MNRIDRGMACPNGAMIIDVKSAWAEGEKVVLCLWLVDKQEKGVVSLRNADPYVTWKARLHPDTGEIVTTSGHYFDILSDAVVDFNSRV